MSLIIQSILLNVILCSLWQYDCSVSWDHWTPYQYRHANLWLTHTRRMHLHICRLIQRTYYTSTLTNYNWHQDYILWGDLTHSVTCLTFNIWNLKSEIWKWGFFSLHNMNCHRKHQIHSKMIWSIQLHLNSAWYLEVEYIQHEWKEICYEYHW